jgi:beta-phosphoglucomutase-like phosphatase (HAD superfamily)
MSQRSEALHILRCLELERTLDLVFTREDVQNSKPDPKFYLMADSKLKLPLEECLVMERSPTDVWDGVTARKNAIAVATPFTIVGLHSSQVLDLTWVSTTLWSC